jgi:outer membrane receptor for ferrienterochelin and colicins
MRLPLLSDLDPRPEYSPIWSLQNIQFTYKKFRSFELYGGVKNILNWTPNKGTPFLIAGAENPFGESFDATYVYAPNQGIRGFLGIRYTIY